MVAIKWSERQTKAHHGKAHYGKAHYDTPWHSKVHHAKAHYVSYHGAVRSTVKAQHTMVRVFMRQLFLFYVESVV